MSTQVILDQMILVVLNITLWQGRKALQAGDLALNGIDVPNCHREHLPRWAVKESSHPIWP